MLNADNSLLIVSCAFPVINKNELENKEKNVEREKKNIQIWLNKEKICAFLTPAWWKVLVGKKTHNHFQILVSQRE